jgi:S-adenosylmethionine decarboxylase
VSAAEYQAAGSHVLADLHGVAQDKLRDAVAIESLLLQSARAAGAQILNSHFHSFGAGKGVTGVVLLAESHITIHTWPEFGFAAADIFMCGRADAQRALHVLRDALRPTSSEVRTIARGMALESSGGDARAA